MNFPIEIGIGYFSINAHLLLEILAFFLGFKYYQHLKKNYHDTIGDLNRLWILVGAAFGALLFSRLVGGLENPHAFFSFNRPFLEYYQNKTIVGALFGGLLFVEITKKIIGVKTSSGDLYTYPLILGMIIGRIGCFSMGVYEPTFGIESSLPWAINLGDGILRHPTAIYEMLFLILLWASLIQLEKRVAFKNGYRFQFFIMSYFLFRFLIEFIKPAHFFSYGLSTIQITCLIGLLYYFKTFYKLFFASSLLIKKDA